MCCKPAFFANLDFWSPSLACFAGNFDLAAELAAVLATLSPRQLITSTIATSHVRGLETTLPPRTQDVRHVLTLHAAHSRVAVQSFLQDELT